MIVKSASLNISDFESSTDASLISIHNKYFFIDLWGSPTSEPEGYSYRSESKSEIEGLWKSLTEKEGLKLSDIIELGFKAL